MARGQAPTPPLVPLPTAKGFEPLRAEPNGFLVHHLNHSVTLSTETRVLGALIDLEFALTTSHKPSASM